MFINIEMVNYCLHGYKQNYTNHCNYWQDLSGEEKQIWDASSLNLKTVL